MAHFGLLCPPATSHVTGLSSVGRALISRGHRATLFNILDVEKLAKSEGLEFVPLGIEKHPLGSFRAFSEKIAQLKGIQALRFGLRPALAEIEMLLTEAPDALRAANVDVLLCDQGQPTGSTIAELLGIPFLTICNASPANREPCVPPTITHWMYGCSFRAKLRNELAYELFSILVTPLRRKINVFRSEHGLAPIRSLDDTFSPLAQISQQSREFDFPHHGLPAHFHHIGLFHRPGSSNTSFPYERLNGKPLVFASFGTILCDKPEIFEMLAQACHELDTQLVITLGGRGRIEQYQCLPGNPIVVNYAPQLEVLKHTSLTVCHAGTNTVLESLQAGVPVVTVPVWADQPGVAARLVYSGAGERLMLGQLSCDRFREVCGKVLREPKYRQRALAIGESIRNAGGEERAADIIENCLQSTDSIISTARTAPPA
ncbi:MAG: glycosyltransferase family 1 protein [Acidobacteriaceae bacterium]|nr:glycosyltransferase family 1 protein [Acidobacteriaceae bacterium]